MTVGTHSRYDLVSIIDNDRLDDMSLEEKVKRAVDLAKHCETCRNHLADLLEEFYKKPRF